MRTLLSLSIATTLATLVACAAPPADHAMHGDQAGTGPAGAASCDAHMGAMRAMHDKMMAARTPQEREALRAEHMKAMQAGNAAMPGMAGASGPMPGMGGMGGMGRGMAMSPETMARCQAMMDRGAPASAPAAK